MSILDFSTTREDWIESVYLKSKSMNSKTSHMACIKNWDLFLKSINEKDEDVLRELKGKSNEPDIYLFLNRYVQYLIKRKLKKATIVLNFAVLRSWCSSNGVMLHNEFVKKFVIFPSENKMIMKPLTPEIIKQLTEKQVKEILDTVALFGMDIYKDASEIDHNKVNAIAGVVHV